jgi:hypothetical protein
MLFLTDLIANMLKQTIASKNSLLETLKLILLSVVNQLLEKSTP